MNPIRIDLSFLNYFLSDHGPGFTGIYISPKARYWGRFAGTSGNRKFVAFGFGLFAVELVK